MSVSISGFDAAVTIVCGGMFGVDMTFFEFFLKKTVRGVL